ncbi:protein of unknown function [Methanocaldococcus lauensis]|uniref:ATPase n=1 Tax=Methanocaldococcus lauensis TaxID=2546128 RepID=A0A8D6SZ41_9EURY|nr:protein of unknown function [Methanocaldococcus lauensis]
MNVFENLYRNGKLPILIIDELQKIGDMEINGFLIYELFNFFIDLTKEKHLCHVFCLSSDSLFIEKVYDEAMLRDRVDYILVDDFDKENALKFINFYAKEKNIELKEEKELIYSHVGGKLILIIKVINKMKVKDLNNILDELLKIEISKLENLLEDIKERNYNVNYEEVITSLRLFKNTYSIPKSNIKKDVKTLLIKKNYLFLNPITNEIKPQSFLIWNAIKRIL